MKLPKAILEENKIPVAQSETGGYFSCRLGLNLNTWENQIHPINIPNDLREDAGLIIPDKRSIEDIMLNISPIPQIALKLVRMIKDDAGSLEDMGKEIRQDQVISARV